MPSSSSTGPLPAFSEAQFTALRHDSADAVESYLLDSDGLDAVFFLYAIVVYVAARLALNLVAPGLHKSAATASARRYSRQQYLMVFFQKGFVMPVCGLGFFYGVLPSELTYLLTGAYVLSDSIVNAKPVRGGSWGGNMGVHAHHVFTVAFCAVGAHLESGPVNEGALVILVGEMGSLWLTVTILHPTRFNIKIRFFTFVASRLAAFVVGINLVRRTQSWLNQLVMLSVIAFLSFDNWKTLKAMSGVGGVAAGSLGRSDSLAADMKNLGKGQ